MRAKISNYAILILVLTTISLVPIQLAKSSTQQEGRQRNFFGEPENISAQCALAGTPNIFWDTDCEVDGDITIGIGVTLTINAGVTVKFATDTSLIVNGKLVARGTLTQPITFTANQGAPQPDDWNFIHFTNNSADNPNCDNSGSILQYAIIEYAGGDTTNENGALRIQSSDPCIDNNIIQNNGADGIHVWQRGNPVLTNNTVTDNEGQGIYVNNNELGAQIDILGNTVSRNTNTGIFANVAGPFSVNGNTITSNTAQGATAGGIHASSGNAITITGNMVWMNSSATSAGGIYASSNTAINIISNTVKTNTSAMSAGGIQVVSNAPITINDNDIEGNTSSNAPGGGVFLSTNLDVDIFRNTIIGNETSNGSGGGIFAQINSPNLIEIKENTIQKNKATGGSGGGIFLFADNIDLRLNTIVENTTSSMGGGIYISPTASTNGNIVGNIIAKNIASDKGGGIFLNDLSQPTIHDNDICLNRDAFNGDIFNGMSSVDAEGNYWGVSLQTEVEDRIWHQPDDNNLGLVDFDPFQFSLTSPINDPKACTFEIYLPAVTNIESSFFEGPNEEEPNNNGSEANGPLRSNRNYFGLPNDPNDYFFIVLTTPGQITIDMIDHPLSSVQGAQLQLKFEGDQPEDRVAFDLNNDLDNVYHIEYSATEIGTYFIQVFTDLKKCGNCSTPYTLNVIYPNP